jgi:hypothetical protein
MGESPETTEMGIPAEKTRRIVSLNRLGLPVRRAVNCSMTDGIASFRSALPQHQNALRFAAYVQEGAQVKASTYLSVDGCFVHKNDNDGKAQIAKSMARCVALRASSMDR